MKDWIKRALTKKIRQQETTTTEIQPDPRLVYGAKFTIAMTLCLSALEIAHMIVLGKWNSEIFAAITDLIGSISGILIGSKS